MRNQHLIVDLVGRRFGLWEVVARSEFRSERYRGAHWECVCDCGKERTVYGQSLRSGASRSCGCRVTHGHTVGGVASRTYSSWRSAINRCFNVNEEAYPAYGGKGITVCERWLGRDGFKNFLADMGKRPDATIETGEYTIDRYPNNAGNYEPGNCRWATDIEQAANRRKFKGYQK